MPSPHLLDLGESGRIGGYRLTRVLGEGGQGAVYLGRAPQGGDVAIKVLHAQLADDADARRRFLREAEVARRVAPFCTARVLEVGLHGDRPYIVSEYVPGVSLDRVVRQDGPRTGGALERLAVATASALAAIHRAGVVHRDFKPDNVILGPEGPVVIDFGLSRSLDQSGTRTGTVGTPAYMAPEQLTGTGGQAADVFAWAGTMVFAATGHRAFPAESVPALLHAIVHRDPDLSGVPDNLRQVVAACLAKDPAARPTAADLLVLLTGDTLHLPPPAPPQDTPSVPPWGRPMAAPAQYDPHTPAQDGQPREVGTAADAAMRAGNRIGQPPEVGTAVPSWGMPQPGPPSHERASHERASHGPMSPEAPGPAAGTRPSVADTPSRSSADTQRLPARGPHPVPRRAVVAVGIAVAVLVALAVPFWLRGPGDASGPQVGTFLQPGRTPTAPAPPPFGSLIHQPLTEHGNDVRAVALGRLDGKPIAVTGGDDETARVWDLAAGRALGRPLTGHTEWVRSVAFGDLDGRPIVVTASDDDTARVWDPRTGEQIGRPLTGHGDDVKSVALGRLDDTPVAVTAGADGTARVWDLRTGKQLGTPLAGHRGRVWAVAVGDLDGVPIAVTTGDDETVRVWDLRTRRQIGAPLTGHAGWVRSVALGDVDGRTVAVTGGEDRTARVWDLGTGEQFGPPLRGHTGWVWSVAVGRAGGRPVAVTGGEDTTARVWDLSTGRRLGTLTGHGDCVWAVAAGDLGGTPIAVTGSRDETVRVWSLSPPYPSPRS